jgi:hypothetical protein
MGARSALVVAALVLATARWAVATDTVVGSACDLSALGAVEKRAFLNFDGELRVALSTQNPVAAAVLVSYPLRVNHADGSSTSLGNPRAVQTLFGEVFSPAVRSAVLATPTVGVSCTYSGIMYGSGQLWVQPIGEGASQRYRVTTVNVPEPPAARVPAEPSLVFVCETQRDRVVIDRKPAGDVRYRSWNRPRPVTETPDLEIAAGSETGEGTGPCFHTIWTFKSGDATFVVSERGCTDDSVPVDVTGFLEVSIAGRPSVTSPCH